MTRIDFHIHTRRYSPCSKVNAAELVRLAEEKGIDVLIFTEHNRFWRKEELEAINELSEKVTVLNGVEISSNRCHLLVYGLNEDFSFRPGIYPDELFEELSAHEGIAIIPAHPFRYGKRAGELLRNFDFHALETFSLNTSLDASQYAELLARNKNVPNLAASDLHDIGWFGCYWSETEEKITSITDFVRVLKEGKIRTPDFIEAEMHLSGEIL